VHYRRHGSGLLGKREGNYLVEVHADTALPVLAEV